MAQGRMQQPDTRETVVGFRPSIEEGAWKSKAGKKVTRFVDPPRRVGRDVARKCCHNG